MMKRMTRCPTHPGRIIKEDYLLPLCLTIKDIAETLGVSRKTLSKIINERGAVTPDMALRLARAFDTTPDFWLNLQKNYDLWHAEMASQEWWKVKPFPRQMLHPGVWRCTIGSIVSGSECCLCIFHIDSATPKNHHCQDILWIQSLLKVIIIASLHQ